MMMMLSFLRPLFSIRDGSISNEAARSGVLGPRYEKVTSSYDPFFCCTRPPMPSHHMYKGQAGVQEITKRYTAGHPWRQTRTDGRMDGRGCYARTAHGFLINTI